MAAYRHEYKHEISMSDFITLSIRLNAALKADEFARADGAYEITSLYFDDVYNTALKEKISGVNCRDKFRLRRYNNDTEHIKLEKEKQARRPLPEGVRSHNRRTGAKHNRRRYRLPCRSGRRYGGAVQRRACKLQRRIHGLTAMSNSRHTTLFCGIIAALTLALTPRHFPRTRGQLLVSGNFKKAPIREPLQYSLSSRIVAAVGAAFLCPAPAAAGGKHLRYQHYYYQRRHQQHPEQPSTAALIVVHIGA